MSLINKIKRILGDYAEKIYVVGGTVRDRILNREINDYDFAVLGDVSSISKLVAEKLGGSYVPYAEERGTYRVVFEGTIMDFTDMKGKDIYEDLLHRDFTINAMAMKLTDFFDMDFIIDPMGGLNDLRNKKIKYVSENSFDDDPLRMLRAVRFASMYKFNIEEKTKHLIKEKANLIKNISSERIMYEIYIILKSKESFKYIRLMDELGLMDAIFPEVYKMKDIGKCYYHVLDAWHHSIKTVEEYENIIEDLRFPVDISKMICEYLDKDLSSGKKIRDILKLAALFHDIGKPESIYIDAENHIHFYNHDIKGEKVLSGITRRMKMGKKESSLIKKMVLYHMNPLSIYVNGISNKPLFKLFSDLEDDSIGCLLLSQADVVSTRVAADRLSDAEHYRDFILRMFRRYVDYNNTKTPLLTPLDIIVNFDLKNYKLLNQILYEIRKNQFYGDIEDRNDAIKFVEERMKMKKI